MDIQAFREAVRQEVQQRGGLVLSGWVDLPEDRDRPEPLLIHVQEAEPSVWAQLAEHTRPAIVWLRDLSVELEDDLWMLFDSNQPAPPEVQDRLDELPPRERKKVESLRQEIRELCRQERTASLTIAVVINGVVYQGFYEADWVKDLDHRTDAVEVILANSPYDPARRLAKQRAAEQEQRALEQALEEKISTALLEDADFANCTTKGQRYSFAKAAANKFEDQPGYDGVYCRLEEIAEMAFVKAKNKGKRWVKAGKR